MIKWHIIFKSREVSVTEDKTLFEEVLEENSAAYEKHKKLTNAKRLVAAEEWDEADALYDAVLAEFPEDEAAVKGKILLERKKASAEKHQVQKIINEEKKQAKQDARDAKRKPRKPVGLLHSKRFAIICLVVFLLVGAALAAVMGISAHRRSIEEMYADTTTDTCTTTQINTDYL